MENIGAGVASSRRLCLHFSIHNGHNASDGRGAERVSAPAARGAPMQFLAVKCPTTGKFFSTKIETDPETMVALPDDVRARSHRSLCGKDHDWLAREAILANFLPK